MSICAQNERKENNMARDLKNMCRKWRRTTNTADVGIGRVRRCVVVSTAKRSVALSLWAVAALVTICLPWPLSEAFIVHSTFYQKSPRSAHHYGTTPAFGIRRILQSAASSREEHTAPSHVISDEDEFTQLSSELEKYTSVSNDTVSEHSRLAKKKTNSTDNVSSSAGKLVPTAAAAAKDNQSTSGRKLDLIWCGNSEACRTSIRERVVGDHNHMKFEGPATGQVAFFWDDDEADDHVHQRSHGESEKKTDSSPDTAVASVLLLIRPNDEELMAVAAKTVAELTASHIEVLLSPDMAAKLKHYYNVDDEMIKLFEPKPFPGFGGNHVSIADEWMQKPMSEVELNLLAERNPDMICTLGGDGLLMHASLMFPGPCPPILCVAGGSLGFLTPFSRDEMVDAIKVALGVIVHEEDGFLPLPGDSEDPGAIRAFQTMAQHDAYWNGQEMDEDWDDYEETERKPTPRAKFGIGNRICLSMRMRLDCRIINREGVVRARFNVLNEVTIDRGSSPYLANLECFCDNVHLTTVQADGIIFATPTGSTAYSMAAGGSVVHPAVPAILVTPICPHVLSFRSMIFPDSVVLRCYVPDDARSSAAVAFDGRYRRELNRGDSVQIQMCHYPVPTINRVDHSSDWLGSLKRSFNFNSRPRQRPL